MRQSSAASQPDQFGLFAAEIQTLIEDDQGGVIYRPEWVGPTQAEGWFEVLRDTIGWQHERRMMYQREVDVPRLVARCNTDDPDLPPALKAIGLRVCTTVGVRFTSIGLNYYRDGRDSVAPHHDRLEELVPGYPIALVSLGATRRMHLSTQQLPRRSLNLDLAPGSLLVMSYASQLHWLHGIPKRTFEQPPRISLAFRVRPEGSEKLTD